MGCGQKAKKNSSINLKTLEKALKNNLNENILIENLESEISKQANIDACIINSRNGNMEIIKNKANPTYIITKNKLDKVNDSNLENDQIIIYDKDLNRRRNYTNV